MAYTKSSKTKSGLIIWVAVAAGVLFAVVKMGLFDKVQTWIKTMIGK